VFFRSPDMSVAGRFLRAMFGFDEATYDLLSVGVYVDPWVLTLALAGVIGSAPVVPWLARVLRTKAEEAGSPLRRRLSSALVALQWPALALVLLLCLMTLAAGTYSPFIYFRF